MKKVNVELPNQQWGTIKTKYPNNSDLVGYDELTNGSKNFDTTVKGSFTKRPGGIFYNVTPFAAPPKDEYEAIFNDGVHHMLTVTGGTLKYTSGGGTFSDVTTGYSALGNFEFALNQDRVYFDNGIDAPQVYDRNTSYGGVVYTAPKTKVMGAQAPSTAPTGVVAAGGNIPVGGHTYKVTFLYYDLEESNGGPASGTITTTPGNQTINLSSVPIGGYGVTARKIYRDANDGVWLLVGTITDNTTTVFSDTASTGTAPIPTDHNTPPTYKYIVAHLDRNWIAGIPGDPFAVYFSEAGLPNVFPARNRIACNPADPITALYVYNDKVWVLNRNSLGSILGTTSDQFRYSILPSSIGCVDNRSIQVRTTTGIPTMIWLSSKGVYGTNGSSVVYLSDSIEDLINLNIQQANQVKGQNAQTTQSAFLGGTSSPGIDLSTRPGFITTGNPKRLWDTQTEWEAGSSLTNIATHTGDNTIQVPTEELPLFNQGTHAGTVEISGTLRTPVFANYTGESSLSISSLRASDSVKTLAQRIRTPRNGNLTSLTFNVFSNGGPAPQIRMMVWADNGSGAPGSVIYTGPFQIPVGFENPMGNAGLSVALTGNTNYWIGVEYSSNQNANGFVHASNGGWEANASNVFAMSSTNGSNWIIAASGTGNQILGLSGAYSFTQSAVGTAGLWTGPIMDSGSDSAVGASLIHTGAYPGLTSGVTTLEMSNDPDMLTGITSQNFSNLNGTGVVSLSGNRYWRVKVQLSTMDDRVTAQVGAINFKYSTTGIWISEVIDHTTDVTTLDVLSMVSSVPSGTSATIEIATSANNITYSAFGPIGSAVVQRYSKIRITLTTNGTNSTSAIVTSALFTWTLVSNLQSSAIDTGSTPAGWDIFQSQFDTNGGTVAFFMRTASTAPGLTAASYVAVTNGQFPTNTVLQFVQWKVVITSTADQVPAVDSVTINWFISTTNSIRVASLFYNRSYYLAAAEYNQPTNNLMIVWDGEGNWRTYRGITAATMGFFFNDPYYGSSVVGQFVKFLQSTTDQGTPIEMIVDTRSIEFEDPDHTKVLRKLYLRGMNTGAAYQVYFSLDGGQTFHLMIDEATGGTTFTTSSNGLRFYRRFIPNFALGQPTAGKQIMFRIREATAATVQLEGLKAEAWIRNGELFENADVM